MDAFSLPALDARSFLATTANYAILDVRRRPAALTSGEQLAGAVWYDPEALTLNHEIFASDRPLAIYCVHGHEVSAMVTAMALVSGRDARMITGGFEALKAEGANLVSFPQAGETAR